jgi:hypothetical protein
MAELNSQPTTVQSVYSWYADKKLHVNRRYQRKLVWTLKEKQRLIESILKKYPIPAILIAEAEWEGESGIYEIIDGLQRLQAIVSFIENAFPTLDGTYFDVKDLKKADARAEQGVFFPNKQAQYLSAEDSSTLLDYVLALSVMRGATEVEVDDVFSRINTFGHRLSDQERRQAGVKGKFSEMVRNIACTIRGDVSSSDFLPLEIMPSISIDLPKTKHGYSIPASEVFWVEQGILRSTDLRDSMDEQCIADIAACIIGGKLIERSKNALDKIYDSESSESKRIANALDTYGADRFSSEFKYCIDEIIKVCNEGESTRLRNLLFARKTNNSFQSVFSSLFIAFHNLIILEKKAIGDYLGVKKSLAKLTKRIETGKSATSPDERDRNIKSVDSLIREHFSRLSQEGEIYNDDTYLDVNNYLRRISLEVSNFELKQGLLNLDESRKMDESAIQKVMNTICAIANNGPNSKGIILIGVADKPRDAQRIEDLDGISPIKISERSVVGIDREAKILKKSREEYLGLWKDKIRSSSLPDHLQISVLSNIRYNSYHGLGVIIIQVPKQKQLSLMGEDLYYREVDETKKAKSMKTIAQISQRFSA